MLLCEILGVVPVLKQGSADCFPFELQVFQLFDVRRKDTPYCNVPKTYAKKEKNPRNEKASECCCLVNRADKMKWPHIFCDKTPKKVERRLWWRWQILWKWNLLEDLHRTVVLNHWPCVWILVYSVNKKGVVKRVRLAQKAAASGYNILNQGTRYWTIQGFSKAFLGLNFWWIVFLNPWV